MTISDATDHIYLLKMPPQQRAQLAMVVWVSYIARAVSPPFVWWTVGSEAAGGGKRTSAPLDEQLPRYTCIAGIDNRDF